MYPGTYAKSKPDAPAGIAAASGEQLTWKELDAGSNRLAWYLNAIGLRRGDHFALFMENNLRYFEIAWAAQRSGLYLTPINWHLGADEAGYIVRDCGAQASSRPRASWGPGTST